MICFLTSATGPFQTPALYTEYGFTDRLRRDLPDPVRALWIANDPADYVRAEPFALEVRDAFVNAGFRMAEYVMLDNRNADRAKELTAGADLIILSGGEVAVQNRFFARIRLKELLADWDGVLVAISAGTMNSAETVPVPPSVPGDPTDPAQWPVLPGLGLTKHHVVPHFQYIRTQSMPGIGPMEAYFRSVSRTRPLLALDDTAYLYRDAEGNEKICGRAYRIADGTIVPWPPERDV